MNENLKDQEVLLVKDKEKDNLSVACMEGDGKVKTAKPEKEDNPDFLKIGNNDNALQCFFENFARQVKDPTRFEFFRLPEWNLNENVQNLQNALKNPNDPEKVAFVDMRRVNPEDYLEKQSQGQKYNAIDESHINWDQFEKLGITRETLEKTNNLEKLLNWQKTDLLPITIKTDDLTVRTEARLALRETPEGNLSVSVNALRKAPELERPYFGVQFTDEDKKKLLTTGNLGRIVEAEFTCTSYNVRGKQGEKTPVFLSVDRQTNELIACRADKIKIPENIKGVQLNENQKKELSEGKAVWVEGMTSKSGKDFSAYLQFNAEKRGIEFRFDSERQKQSQSQTQSNQPTEAPKTFRKRELSEDQRSSLNEGKTVYVDGLEDKKGKKYSGYITLNKENGKTDFMFPKDYKDALAAGKVVPDDRHKTQVAVNSEGKTNEATKHQKEPLKEGQIRLDKKADIKTQNELRSNPNYNPPPNTVKEWAKEKKEEKQETKKTKGVKM